MAPFFAVGGEMLPPEIQDMFADLDIIDYRVTHHSDKKVQIELVGYPLMATQSDDLENNEVSEVMKNAVQRAARDLYEVGWEYGHQRTIPETGRPRRKEIELCPGYTWPGEARDEYQYIWAVDETGLKQPVNTRTFTNLVISTNHGMPNGVLRSVRRMQQAARWCRKRIQGREKAARDILATRTQHRAYVALEAEGMLNVLDKGW